MSNIGNHNRPCEDAKGHQCKCTGCGGALHGWQGAVTLAREDTASRREQRRQEIDQNWRDSYDPRSKRPNQKNKAASIDSARIDVVDWLARNLSITNRGRPNESVVNEPHVERQSEQSMVEKVIAESIGRSSGEIEVAVVDYVEQFGNVIAKATYRELDTAFAGVDLKEARQNLANHFWCDLFVALAQAIQKLQEHLDKVPRYVKKLILKSSKQAKRSRVTRFVIGFAVDKAWSALINLPIFHAVIPPIGKILRTLRILALLTCPAPEYHKEVRDQCITPLAKEMLSTETKSRLKAVLMKDWTEDV
jgi:hypothetical protein